MFPFGYRHGNRGSNKIALTFDDGPTVYTLKVLGILKENNVKATFFLIGKHIEQKPKIVQEILMQGHEIGMHTYNHPVFGWKEKFFDKFPESEITKTQEILQSITGNKVSLFRPTKSLALHKHYRQMITKYNLIPVLASAYSRAKRTVDRQLKDITKHLQAGDIILMHDSYDKDINSDRWYVKTEKILPKVIEYARKHNLEFVTISNLLSLK